MLMQVTLFFMVVKIYLVLLNLNSNLYSLATLNGLRITERQVKKEDFVKYLNEFYYDRLPINELLVYPS